MKIGAKKSVISASVLAVTATLPIAPNAMAQGALALEEVVVSARKRIEDLQDVGLSVSALTETESCLKITM